MRIAIACSFSFLGVLSMACSGPAHTGDPLENGAGGDDSSSSGVTSNAAATGSGNGGSVPNFPEASHPPSPLVKNFGGPVLATPEVVPITFPGDAFLTQIEDFVGTLGATSYWSSLAEYGVGPVTMRSPVHLASNPFPSSVDDAQIQTWIAAQIGNGGLPPSDGKSIYALFFPGGQTITHQGGSSCTQFGGYHGEAPLGGGQSAPYAILPRCAAPSNGLTGLAALTAAAAHELIEACADPHPDTKPAYLEVQSIDFGWEIDDGGGEIADMCQVNADAFFQPMGFAYTVQRSWSNKAAAGGHDPCVPAPAGPYFNSAPVLPDSIMLSLVEMGMPVEVAIKGVNIPVGSNKTIEVDLFSDAATSGPWTVSAQDPGSLLGFSFDKTSGQNGDKLQLTITALSGSFTNIEPFVISSTSGAVTNRWVGLVGF